MLPLQDQPPKLPQMEDSEHEHVSLEYSDCSRMQNCDCGKEEYAN